jgi:hypothetical protein
MAGGKRALRASQQLTAQPDRHPQLTVAHSGLGDPHTGKFEEGIE